jgi:hypothetical protein
LKPSDLYLFIAQCLSLDNDLSVKEKVVTVLSGDDISWEDFVWTGSSHYILPALFTAFRRNGLLPLLPVDLVSHMEHIYTLNYQRNQDIIEQCRTINSHLNHSGIEFLFLKGAGNLLSGLYVDPGDRIMEDIDILVSEKDIQKAVSCLLSLDYLPEKSQRGEDIYKNHHHLAPMVNRSKTAPVELHRTPVQGHYDRLITPEEVLKNSEQIPGEICRIPSVLHRQLLVFFHEQRWYRGYWTSLGSLKGMYDFYLLTQRFPPIPGCIPSGKHRKRFQNYIFFTNKIFGSHAFINELVSPGLQRVWKRELFLLNHSRWDSFWHNHVFSVFAFCELLIGSIWSRSSREMLFNKIFRHTGKF